jgi:hypothetical protein
VEKEKEGSRKSKGRKRGRPVETRFPPSTKQQIEKAYHILFLCRSIPVIFDRCLKRTKIIKDGLCISLEEVVQGVANLNKGETVAITARNQTAGPALEIEIPSAYDLPEGENLSSRVTNFLLGVFIKEEVSLGSFLVDLSNLTRVA